MRAIGVARSSILVAGLLLVSGCVSGIEFSDYRRVAASDPRDERVFLQCRDYARRVVRGGGTSPGATGSNGPDRLASGVGSIIGSGIGDQILFRRAVDRCMKENGYVRNDENAD